MQAQYRNYPTNQRSPHATARSRGPAHMMPGQQQQHMQQAGGANAHQLQIQQQQQMEAARREHARRISRRPTDKNLPDGMDELVIGDAAQRYQKLREVEQRLDAVMMRKRLDVQDSSTRTMSRCYRTMRIWISNTAENQPWQQTGMDPDAFDFNSESQATYRVKIEGRLLDDDSEATLDVGSEGKAQDKSADKDNSEAMDHDAQKESKTDTEENPENWTGQRTKMSHFFKAITVDFDRSRTLQPDGFTQIEWKKPEVAGGIPEATPEGNFDCLEFERKGDENINVTVNMIRDDLSPIFRLSKPLAKLLDTEEDDRPGVLMSLWAYIKANHLQEDDDARKVVCDSQLRQIFNTDTIFFPHLPNLINHHLQPIPPLQLPYTIRVDQAYVAPSADSEDGPTQPSVPTVYDVLVPMGDPFRTTLNSFLQSSSFQSTLTTIQNTDTSLALSVQAISHARAKHTFFTSLSKDPVGFVKRWTSSQRRDAEVILGETSRGGSEDTQGEEWRKGGRDSVWASKEAQESVALWLARRGNH